MLRATGSNFMSLTRREHRQPIPGASKSHIETGATELAIDSKLAERQANRAFQREKHKTRSSLGFPI